MKQFEQNFISMNDVLHTLKECYRNERYEGMLDHMLLFASELTGLSEDALLKAMYPEKEFPNLSLCADFEKLQSSISYGTLKDMEEVIRLYEETDKIITNEDGGLSHVDGDFVFPPAIAWYCGMMDTDTFIEDFGEPVAHPFVPADYAEKDYTETENRKTQAAAIKEYLNQDSPLLYDDLKIWCTAVGELWDPHKNQYIETSQLPNDLLNAYETLWEETGDDYLVEYCGNYYYMLDHVYHETLIPEAGELILQDSYESAKRDAEKGCTERHNNSNKQSFSPGWF